jgi:putative hemolysin
VSNIGRDAAVVLAFILIGGFFAAAEMALVSLREGQLRSLAHRGKRGQRAARLAQDPNRFLSAVQIGVTTATLLSGAFGAATLAAELRGVLRRNHVPAGLAATLSLVAVTVAISYFSLVLGELVPKRLALQRPEPIALAAAPVLDRISAAARPLVWLLSRSVDLVVRVLGGNPRAGRDAMSSDELRDMVTAHTDFGADERHIVGEVFDAGKRQLREVLLPRTEVEFIDAAMPMYRAAKIAASATHSRFPVYRDSYDDVIGFVHLRDLLNPDLVNREMPVQVVCRPVKQLPQSKTVLAALTEMRNDRSHLAIVVDEYGGTAGIVTLEDLLEELIGDIRDEYDVEDEQAKRLLGGEVEVDGLLNLDDFADETGVTLPEGPYETVAGYVMAALGKLPEPGDSVEASGHRLTVTEMDGRRIARIRVAPAGDERPDQAPPEQRMGGTDNRSAAAENGPMAVTDGTRAGTEDGGAGAEDGEVFAEGEGGRAGDESSRAVAEGSRPGGEAGGEGSRPGGEAGDEGQRVGSQAGPVVADDGPARADGGRLGGEGGQDFAGGGRVGADDDREAVQNRRVPSENGRTGA